jgi:hypothetical protein
VVASRLIGLAGGGSRACRRAVFPSRPGGRRGSGCAMAAVFPGFGTWGGAAGAWRHKRSARVTSLALWFASHARLAAVAIDGPYHGERASRPLAAAEYQARIAAEGIEVVLDRMAAEWRATVEALGALGIVDTSNAGDHWSRALAAELHQDAKNTEDARRTLINPGVAGSCQKVSTRPSLVPTQRRSLIGAC